MASQKDPGGAAGVQTMEMKSTRNGGERKPTRSSECGSTVGRTNYHDAF